MTTDLIQLLLANKFITLQDALMIVYIMCMMFIANEVSKYGYNKYHNGENGIAIDTRNFMNLIYRITLPTIFIVTYLGYSTKQLILILF